MVEAERNKHVAYVGLGSNMGNREKNIAAALNSLESTRGINVTKASALYETEPVGGPPGQDSFINAVVRVETTLTSRRLLAVCLNIEDSLGRKRSVRWGPRTIDLDLLSFDDEIRASAKLMLPHPHMHTRRFVMEPLAEIAPDFVHPTLEQTAAEILDGLPEFTGGHD
ncbi:MAG: 2-amino-4-hydroxy-6-hydroxymethyldihydropteridine diphosphokinase [Planctomycetota bacterium]|nr:2-amino-4-hydroxy-6-hydroxymethyldihydropteridine diphosphokinase [Planctomycetota bacterium]MCZ6815465.1 2-amino-4-hydroxy-6-hydroxymethyldihydropteridine diphosphokinase [Planctomycetota bacterium]